MRSRLDDVADLSVLEEFGARLQPPDGQPPEALRRRVCGEMAAGRSRPRVPLRSAVRRLVVPRPGGTRRRLAWRIGLPAGATVAVAAALFAGSVTVVAGPQPGQPDAGGPTAAAPVASQDRAAGAGRVLRLAAHHAEATPALDARPDQFLLVESVEVQSENTLGPGPDGKITVTGTRVLGPFRVRTWLSVDGTRDGLVRQDPTGSSTGAGPSDQRISGCRDGRRSETVDRPDTTAQVPCEPVPAYQHTNLPTDPEGMLAYLYADRGTGGTPGPVDPSAPTVFRGRYLASADQNAFERLIELLSANRSPLVQAAAFRAAERIPGVVIRENAADAAGRIGVAVTRTEGSSRHELVFDPRTYAYLGTNVIATEPTANAPLFPGQKPGDVIYQSALLRIVVVDQVGRLS